MEKKKEITALFILLYIPTSGEWSETGLQELLQQYFLTSMFEQFIDGEIRGFAVQKMKIKSER
jgi:hypothetical protein